ncbi:MAG: glycosyltransferase family 4 protein [Planctomycetota bacterium]
MPGGLRIAHIVDYLMPTMGYQEFLLPKWNALHGHDVHIITSDRYTPIPSYDAVWGPLLGPRNCGRGIFVQEDVTIHRLPVLFEVKSRPWLGGFRRALRSIRPDVVFCHGTASFNALRSGLLARRDRVPLLMDNHMTFGCRNRSLSGRAYYALLRLLTRWILIPHVHHFFGVADECSAFLREEQRIPQGKIGLLPLGIDTELFQPDSEGGSRIRDEHSIPADARVVLQTGKLTEDKGPHLLAEAMAPLMRKDPDLWLVFVGSGPNDMLDRIHAPLAAQRVEARLEILPLVPAFELSAVYSMADLCVFPAAASLSALEAAACGRAVVMTDLPACRWRASCGVGLTYPAGDVNALRETIGEILGDADKRLALARRGREAVLASFSYDRIARDSEAAMREAVYALRQPAGLERPS